VIEVKHTYLFSIAYGLLTLVALPALAEPLTTAIEKALAGEVRSVSSSSEQKLGVFSEGNDYIAVLKDGREVELTLKIVDWDLNESPYFWFANSTDPENDGVLEPNANGLHFEKVPKSWMASDYQEKGKTRRTPSLLAGNIPREITKASDTEYVLSSEFTINRQLMTPTIGRLLIKHNTKNHRIYVASLAVRHCPDEKRARTLLQKLTQVARAQTR
jgi:hypothetical protein